MLSEEGFASRVAWEGAAAGVWLWVLVEWGEMPVDGEGDGEGRVTTPPSIMVSLSWFGDSGILRWI